eukprot:TRINITY_DN6692_c3_g1_i1.p1 TRINITY_DN6692_c3_g1~~TRINITY_DN6692_c3_g1_i1.p1  ORF type:complete len:112 (+),score=4.25 TRINITY_DN6692_c3_g1_i1:44-379(+)
MQLEASTEIQPASSSVILALLLVNALTIESSQVLNRPSNGTHDVFEENAWASFSETQINMRTEKAKRPAEMQKPKRDTSKPTKLEIQAVRSKYACRPKAAGNAFQRARLAD